MDGENAGRAAGGGMGFCSGLTILFIAFKLLKIIKWSWVWVLAPLWIPSTIILIIIIVAFIIAKVRWG